jgi:hypothetical protein
MESERQSASPDALSETEEASVEARFTELMRRFWSPPPRTALRDAPISGDLGTPTKEPEESGPTYPLPASPDKRLDAPDRIEADQDRGGA